MEKFCAKKIHSHTDSYVHAKFGENW